MNRIGLLIIATGKYDVFIEPLLHSVDKYFFKNEPVDIYLFSDKIYWGDHSERINIIGTPIEHNPFPYATLYRYRHFTNYFNLLQPEFLYYIDVDMRIVAPIGDEILPNESGLTATIHPGFYKGGGSWENNSKSKAWIPKELQNKYYAGGFQGGKTGVYLNACEQMDFLIKMDEENGVMACWQDESHWNRYLCNKNPKELSPSYCYPESWRLPFPKKILALDKEHDKMRS